MRISTRGRYALRLMLDLAINNNGEYIPLKEVAARQEISDKYLEQIIPVLNKAGFVRSVRGSQGGYKLARDASEYTAGMILKLVEGSTAPVACIETEPNSCPRYSQCATVTIYEAIQKAIDDVVDNITLQDLVDIYNQKCGLAAQDADSILSQEPSQCGAQ